MRQSIKYSLLLLFLLIFSASIQTSNEELFLLYTPDDKRVSKMCLDEAPIFLYKIQQNNKRIITIALTALDSVETQVVDLESFGKTHQLENIDWLTKKFLVFYNYFKGEEPYKTKGGKFKEFNLSKQYDKIYVVVPKPNSKKAQVFRVGQNPFFDID